jgi:hypothetical protein
MFTFNERDLQRMPKPAKAHLPIRNDIDLSLIDDETGREHEVVVTPTNYVNSAIKVYPAINTLVTPNI